MYAGKPVIGVVGGIGSGKSFVARLLGEMGCLVLDSDQHVTEAYALPEVQRELVQWLGPQVIGADGLVDRAMIARRVFADESERRWLEHLIHPIVGRIRDRAMRNSADDPSVRAYVWDTPLLFEVGLDRHCDAVIFVEAPEETRIERVTHSRGWAAGELVRREKSQMGLDKKREMSDHVVRNTAGADQVRTQLREVLSRIFAEHGRLRGGEAASH